MEKTRNDSPLTSDIRTQRRQEMKESLTITGAGETSVEFHARSTRREYVEGMDFSWDTTVTQTENEMEFGSERPSRDR